MSTLNRHANVPKGATLNYQQVPQWASSCLFSPHQSPLPLVGKERKKKETVTSISHFLIPCPHQSVIIPLNQFLSSFSPFFSPLPLWIVYPVSLLLHHSFTAPSPLPSHSNLPVWKVFPEKGMWEDRPEWWIAPWMLHFVLSPRTGPRRDKGTGGGGGSWRGRKGMSSFKDRGCGLIIATNNHSGNMCAHKYILLVKLQFEPRAKVAEIVKLKETKESSFTAKMWTSVSFLLLNFWR